MSEETRAEGQVLRTASLLILAAVATAVALIYTRSVMVPFVLSLLLSYMIGPLVDFLQDRAKFPRWAAILAAIFSVVGFFALVALLITSSVSNLGNNAELYNQRLISLTENLTTWMDEQNISIGQEEIVATVRDLPLFDWLKRTAGSVVNFLSNVFLVLIFVIYLLARRGDEPSSEAAALQGKIRNYLVTKFTLSAITGVLVGGILWILGVDLALVFGLLAFLLNFIPNVGSLISTLLPLPIVLMQFDSTALIVLAIALPGAVQMVIGNVFEPRMLGKSVDLNPITILLALMFWGLIWGIVGMLLATPLTAVLKVQLARFHVTRPIAHLMGTRDETPAPPAAAETPEPSGAE